MGVTIPKLLPDDPQATYSAVAEAVRIIEEAGFDPIWIPDVLNRGYLTFDPLIYAAVVASLSRVREIGTAVLQVGRHDAVDLAGVVAARVDALPRNPHAPFPHSRSPLENPGPSR